MSKTKTLPHIEVILPIYNEVNNLLPLLAAFEPVLLELSNRAKLTFLFINDGSRDGSRQLLHKLQKERSDIRVVDLIHNFGHGSALACGIDLFDGDAAVIMDADLQDSPQAILPMFDAWERGHRTVVIERGNRKERSQWAFRLFYSLLHRMAPQLPRINYGTHSLLDKRVIARLRAFPERHRYLPGLVSLASDEILAIRFDRNSRKHGSSRVGTVGLVNLAVTAIISFSSAPVRLVSGFGLVCALVALGAASVIVGIKLFTSAAIPGWASTLTAIFFGNGIQLLCVGLIGEYIARIYDESKQRPLYLIDRILESKKSQRKAA